MKKRRKWLWTLMLFWILMFLLATTGIGCFSTMKRDFGRTFGGSWDIGMKEILLDTVTLPLQIVVLGPLLVADIIDANTGECGEQTKWKKAKDKAYKTLENDFDSIFADERYFSVTNTPQREMLGNWLAWYNKSQLTTRQVQRIVSKVMENPYLLEPLAPICMRGGMTAEQRKWCMSESLNLATNGIESVNKRKTAPLSWMLQNPTITDEELYRIADMGIKGCGIDMRLAERRGKRK